MDRDDSWIFAVIQMLAIFAVIQLAIKRPILFLCIVATCAVLYGAFMKDMERREQLKQQQQINLIHQVR